MELKRGDKVKCIDAKGASTYLTCGEVYTVELAGMFLRLEGVEGGWKHSRFEKVEDAPHYTGRGGIKHDQGKPRTELLPPDALLGAAQVFSFGASKYGDRNWEKGISNSRLIGAALRHLFSVMKGNLIDKESDLPHIDHALCCVMMLSDNFKNRPEVCK